MYGERRTSPLRFLFSVWNDIEHNEFAGVVTDAVGTLYAEDPPVFLARTPHGHGSPAEIEVDVRAAGFKKCELFQLDNISVAATPDVPAIAYCQGTPLRNEIEAREPGGLQRASATGPQHPEAETDSSLRYRVPHAGQIGRSATFASRESARRETYRQARLAQKTHDD